MPPTEMGLTVEVVAGTPVVVGFPSLVTFVLAFSEFALPVTLFVMVPLNPFVPVLVSVVNELNGVVKFQVTGKNGLEKPGKNGNPRTANYLGAHALETQIVLVILQ